MRNTTLIITTVCLATVCLATGCKNRYQEVPDHVIEETYLFKYGIELPKEEWQSRGQHGKVVSTLANGVTVSKTFSSGTLHGETTYSYPYSQNIEKTEIYSHGAIVHEIWHYPSGAPRQEKRTGDNESLVETTWYENGAPKSLEIYDSKGMLTRAEYSDTHHHIDAKVENGSGTRLLRDAYGAIISRDQISEGEMVQKITYYPNGIPKEIVPFKSRLVEGELKTFHPGGEPNIIETWANGKKTGITIVYQNGEKIAEIPFVNGIRTGSERRYREENLVEEISWVDDKRHGPTIVHLNGTQRQDWYYKNEAVTKKNFEVLNRAAADFTLLTKKRVQNAPIESSNVSMEQ